MNSDNGHDLYYKNLPIQIANKTITINTKLGRYVSSEKSFLDSRPSFLYTGLNRIKKLEKKKLTKREFRYLEDSGLNIYLYEPLCYKITDSHNCEYYSEFLGTENLELIKSNELDSIKKFVIKNKLGNVKVFTCDYNMKLLNKNYPELDLNCYDLTIRNLGYPCSYQDSILKKEIQKKFWSSHRRYTLHRHLISSYLAGMDGIYGWNFICDEKSLLDNPWFNFSNISLNIHKKIIDGNKKLNDSKLIIDSDFPPETVVKYGQSASGMGNVYKFYDKNFLNSVENCFCAVVSETRFAQPFANISEKVFHPMYKKTPFLLVSSAHSLEYLKKLEFKTFNKWWDESYDAEENNEKRMIKIFEVIEYINSKNIKELQNIYNDMQDILDHNFQILKRLSNNRDVL